MSEPKPVYEIVKDGKLKFGENEYIIPEHPIDTNKNFSSGRINKIVSKEEKDYWNKVNNPSKDDRACVIYTMDEILEILKKRGEKLLGFPFVIDADNRGVIIKLIYYFFLSETFESFTDNNGNNYSLKKGIMLRSANSGTGKTVIMKLFSRSTNWSDGINFNSYLQTRVVNTKKVISSYRKDGETIFHQYEQFDNSKPIIYSYMFDELGREDTEANYYGNKCNVMQKILQDRYDMFIDKKVKTHCTTNIVDGNDIEKIYGRFIRSRMREMFNVIDLPGNDRRK
jgi:hypothetical protein